jgi:hypothetical protein
LTVSGLVAAFGLGVLRLRLTGGVPTDNWQLSVSISVVMVFVLSVVNG